MTMVVILTLIPNAIAGVLTTITTNDAVVQHMANAEGVFAVLVVVLNSKLISAGVLIGIWRMNRVCKYVWNMLLARRSATRNVRACAYARRV